MCNNQLLVRLNNVSFVVNYLLSIKYNKAEMSGVSPQVIVDMATVPLSFIIAVVMLWFSTFLKMD